MKIEKLNENQIRCTLTKEDLESRHIDLAELAYGTEKAKALFREMMRFASYKFGFDAEDIPLMIEAVPVSSDAIVLIVTKVPFPDELDARFSEFADYDDEDYEDYDYMENTGGPIPVPDQLGTAKDILDLFPPDGAPEADIVEAAKDGLPIPEEKKEETSQVTRLFEFDCLDDIINVAKIIGSYYHGTNHLYRTDSESFFLIVSIDDHKPLEFNRVCNTLTEFASLRAISLGRDQYIREHCSPVLMNNALKQLSTI